MRQREQERWKEKITKRGGGGGGGEGSSEKEQKQKEKEWMKRSMDSVREKFGTYVIVLFNVHIFNFLIYVISGLFLSTEF